jgi:hypothetical protein
VLAVVVAVVSGTSACESKPTRSSGSSKSRGGCPEGTRLVQGVRCEWDPLCPPGFEYDEKKEACYFPCPDASVALDAELPWLCQPSDGGTAEAGA